MSRLRLRQRWSGLLRVGPLVLLLAFLPSLLYVGHWGEFLDAAIYGTSAPGAASEHTSHEAHCHAGPASCSEQPALSRVEVFPTVVDFPQLELAESRLEASATVLKEFFATIPTEPPRL